MFERADIVEYNNLPTHRYWAAVCWRQQQSSVLKGFRQLHLFPNKTTPSESIECRPDQTSKLTQSNCYLPGVAFYTCYLAKAKPPIDKKLTIHAHKKPATFHGGSRLVN
jgi:hypothetical protein